MTRSELKKILKSILTKPTAPFFEQYVIEEIEKFVASEGFDLQVDKFGNRIAIFKPKGKAKKGKIGFVAHMDHPGFEVVSSNGKTAVAKWRGGVWREYFKKAKVIVNENGKEIQGVVTSTKPMKSTNKRVDTMNLKMKQEVSAGSFGYWDLEVFKLEKDQIITRAADDLISVVSMLALLRELKLNKIKHEVWLIFTRAEEIGFGGTLAMIKSKTIPSDMPLISLETSKEIQGVKQGKGSVIRLGDKKMVFSSDLLAFMEDCAEKLKKQPKSRFKYQKQIMDGGWCEATAFISAGYKTAGIAFPLRNYHNMGEDSTLKSEEINFKDLQWGLELMLEMCRNLSEFPKTMNQLIKKLQKSQKADVDMLKGEIDMSDQRVPMTQQGKDKLKKELDHLKSVERPNIVKEIEVARAHGDLSENAEYQYAKDQQGLIEARVKDLEAKISLAEVIDPTKLSGDRVMFGAIVSLFDTETEKEEKFQIVGAEESDAENGLLSIDSAIAKAIIGREQGDEVRVKTPKGFRTIEIEDVEYPSE